MDNEPTSDHKNPEAAFLIDQQQLLDRAKKGDQEALKKLQKGSKEKFTGSVEQENPFSSVSTAELIPESQVISADLKPPINGSSSPIKAETQAMTQEMLTQMISGDLDVTDPDAVTRAMMQMEEKKAEDIKS